MRKWKQNEEMNEVSETIELTRELSDLRELAAKVREHGFRRFDAWRKLCCEREKTDKLR